MVTMVTGATGFIGGQLATTLLERGDHVRVLVRDAGRAETMRQRGADLVVGDVGDAGSLRRAAEGVEYVYHCAGLVGDWLDRAEARRVNVEGTRSLLAACSGAGVRRLIHFSSLAVFGTGHHYGTDEAAPYRYGDPYTDSKIESERAVLDFAERGELETVSLRPGFVYGPGDYHLLPQLVDALVTGRFAYIGDGSKELNSSYVVDVVQAALLAQDKAEAVGQVYNIADGARTTLREFITFICGYLQIRAPTRRVPVPLVALVAAPVLEGLGRLTRAKEAPLMNRMRLRLLYYNQTYSIEKARRELGYTPRFTYREGLPPTLDWCRSVGLAPKGVAAAPRGPG
jgi:2-alkyl-3-oxoalkanoate reductase